MKQCREQAFLLRLVPYKDHDLIAHFLGQTSGLLGAVLYRARGGKEGFSYQPGDKLELDYLSQEGSDLVRVNSFSPLALIRPHDFTYPRFLCHSFLVDLVTRISVPGQASPGLFGLMERMGTWAWPPQEELRVVLWALDRIGQETGYPVDPKVCAQCGKATVKPGETEWVVRKETYELEEPGLVCALCLGHPGSWSGAEVKALALSQSEAFLDQKQPIPVPLMAQLCLKLSRRLLVALELAPKSLGLFERLLLG